MKYGNVDFKDVDIKHVYSGVLNNVSNFPTIPENIAQKVKLEAHLVLKKLDDATLDEIKRSNEDLNIILQSFEIILTYMDDSDIWSTIDYPKEIVQKIYEELKNELVKH